jgi:hypothetical protein
MLYGNTDDFQHLCSTLWEVTEPGLTLDRATLRDALDMVWDTEMPVYSTTLKALTGQQNRVLETLALTDGKEPFGRISRKVAGDISPGTVQKALVKLEEMDLVFQPYDFKDYHFDAPFLKLCLISQVVYPFEIPIDQK